MADQKKSETKPVKSKTMSRPKTANSKADKTAPEKKTAAKTSKDVRAKAAPKTSKLAESVVPEPKMTEPSKDSALPSIQAEILSTLEHYESLWITGGRLGNFVHDFQTKIRQIETMLDDMVMDRRDRSASILDAMHSLELEAIKADTTRSFWSKLFGTLPHDVFLSGILQGDSAHPKGALRQKLKELAEHFRS